MRSRHSVPLASMAGLERSARLAGESFGFEDVRALPSDRSDFGSRWLWLTAALIAAVGLAALHFA